MKQFQQPDRRQFLVSTAKIAAGFTIGIHLGACKTSAKPIGRSDASAFKANAWLTLRPDGTYLFLLDKVEMGQGAMTGLATVVAEALNTHPESLVIEFAPADRVFNNTALGMQITGGSTSVKSSYAQLAKAGAMMTHAILRAAAERKAVKITSLRLEGDQVFDQSGKVLTKTGALIPHMTDQGLDDIKAKNLTKKPKYIGTFDRRLDAEAKVRGTARFGVDVDMIGGIKPAIAVILRNPRLNGGIPNKVDTRSLEKHPAVKKALVFDFGIALIGSNFGTLKAAIDELTATVKWPAPKRVWDSKSIEKQLQGLKNDEDATEITCIGDPEQAEKDCKTTIAVEYDAPFLAHAPMEPMNATAYFKNGTCKLILPTQNPGLVRAAVASALNLNEDAIELQVTFLGGGFGRRLEADYGIEAAMIARKLNSAVKVMWTREQDLTSGPFRPISKHFFRGGIKNGRPVFWHHQVISPSIMRQRANHWVVGMMPAWSPGWLTASAGSIATTAIKATGKDDTAYEGADNIPYAIPNVRVTYSDPDIDVPVCFFRSVGHSHTGFTVESFIDEMAHLAGTDPLLFRQRLLKPGSRHLAVLNKAADAAGWNTPLPAGHFRGIAAHHSFHSYVGMVVQVKKNPDDSVTIEKVFAAVDCGTVINPDVVRMQIESGVIFGLSMALHSEITLKDGAVQQSNFHQYEVLRMTEHPSIEVHLIESPAKPTGVGEPGVPPLAAAVGNAIFAATGTRHRKMPFTTRPA